MTSAITFKPKVSIITFVVGGVTALLTYLATQNPADAAVFAAISSTLTQGISQYETGSAAGVATLPNVEQVIASAVTTNWPQLQAAADAKVNLIVKDPGEAAAVQAIISELGLKAAQIASASGQSTPVVPIPPA